MNECFQKSAAILKYTPFDCSADLRLITDNFDLEVVECCGGVCFRPQSHYASILECTVFEQDEFLVIKFGGDFCSLMQNLNLVPCAGVRIDLSRTQLFPFSIFYNIDPEPSRALS